MSFNVFFPVGVPQGSVCDSLMLSLSRNLVWHRLNTWFSLPDIIYFDVGTKNPKIIVHNYDFNLARKTQKKTIWVCSFYYKTKCRCRLQTSGRMVYMRADHNHLPKEKCTKFTNLLSQRVTIIRKQEWIFFHNRLIVILLYLM